MTHCLYGLYNILDTLEVQAGLVLAAVGVGCLLLCGCFYNGQTSGDGVSMEELLLIAL